MSLKLPFRNIWEDCVGMHRNSYASQPQKDHDFCAYAIFLLNLRHLQKNSTRRKCAEYFCYIDDSVGDLAPNKKILLVLCCIAMNLVHDATLQSKLIKAATHFDGHLRDVIVLVCLSDYD